MPTPIVESYLALSRLLGCSSDSLRPELFTTAADEAAADSAWTRLELDRNEPVVCLNTGGAYGPAKSWPIEHFAILARRIATESGQAVLVVCGPSERAAARAIAAAADHPRVVSLAPLELSLGLTKACVRRSAMLITTDSGPRHFATAFGVPVLTLVRTDAHRVDADVPPARCSTFHHPVPLRPLPEAGMSPGGTTAVCATCHHSPSTKPPAATWGSAATPQPLKYAVIGRNERYP